MLTIVALLFFPFILALSLYRLFQLPRDLLAGRKWLNRSHPLAAAIASAATYLALAGWTGMVPFSLAQVAFRSPQTFAELAARATVVIGYPFVYLLYAWTYHYALDPRPGSRSSRPSSTRR